MKGKRIRASVRAAAAVLLVAGLVAGCSQEYDDKRGKGDAPAEVFNMPDGFGNLATKCVGHGFRAYVTTNATGPSNVQIVEDKSCAG